MEIFAVLVLFPNFVISQITVTTIPDTDSDPAYVFANEGTDDISLYCIVDNGGTQTVTDWFIMRQTDSNLIQPSFHINGTVIEPADLIGKIEVTGKPFPPLPTITYQTNFTVINFTSDLDQSQIICGPQGSFKTFNFGFTGNNNMTSKLSLYIVL